MPVPTRGRSARSNRHGVDVRSRADALEIALAEVDEVTWSASGLPSVVASRLRTVFEVWTNAGQDPERFRRAIVTFDVDGVQRTRRAWKALR